MRESNKGANIFAIILLVISVVETVVVSIFGAFPWYLMLLSEFAFILGVGLVRFAYEIAYFRNGWHAFWYRNDSDDNEPSEFAVKVTKFSGYLIMIFATIFLLSSAILM